MESWIFLLLIFLISFFAKNNQLMVATIVVLVLKLIPNIDGLFKTISDKGMGWGVTLISITILIPIATGEIKMMDLVNCLKTPTGIIAIICGVLVAILSRHGINLLFSRPDVTVALVFGTIIGVVLFKGVAAGPVIAAGLTYTIVTLLSTIGIK